MDAARRPTSPLRITHHHLFALALVLLTALFAPSARAADPLPMASPTSGGAAASSSATAIPSSAAAGGITITQPAQTADPSYYKIAPGVNVTFAWNFTSVLSYPASLTVQAFCTSNSNTYPIATLPGTATEAIWNPYQYSATAAAAGQPALVQETYRLQVIDERGLGVGASPGLFQPNQKVRFALYIPQSYTPLSSGWICGSCKSAAMAGVVASPLFVALFATLTAFVLSGWSILGRVSSQHQ
ncbi:unnamed protein product [Parajaminaea phylloscopi]